MLCHKNTSNLLFSFQWIEIKNENTQLTNVRVLGNNIWKELVVIAGFCLCEWNPDKLVGKTL